MLSVGVDVCKVPKAELPARPVVDEYEERRRKQASTPKSFSSPSLFRRGGGTPFSVKSRDGIRPPRHLRPRP
jgi:hypothetical protein